MKDAITAALLAASVLSSQALQGNNRNSNAVGRISATDDDSAVDAYIEKLIQSVDETQEDSNGDEPPIVPEHNSDDDASEDPGVLETEGSSRTADCSSSTQKVAGSKAKGKKKKRNRKHQIKKQATREAIENGVGTDLASNVQEEDGKEDDDDSSRIRSKIDEDSVATVDSSSEQKGEEESIPPETTKQEASDSSRQPRPRIPPPNGLYRFFLSKGLIGRLLVMFFILISELIHTLIPSITKAVRAILPRSSHTYQTSYFGRPSTKPKKKSEMVREADQAAFQQLQQAGKEGGKYRHIVSSDFMKRHEIGMYAAKDSEASTEESEEEKDGKTVDNVTKDEEDEDASWIIEALSNEAQDDKTDIKEERSDFNRPKRANSKKHRSSTKINSQRASRVHAAIKIPQKKLKKRSNSFGSKLIGKFASADNRFSRNLLGAYPGDAVPLEEAANAAGLSELARRYGWGKWPSEVESGRRKRRRKATPSTKVSFGLDFGGSFDNFGDPPFPEVRAIKRSRRFNSHSNDREELTIDVSPDEGGNPLDFGDPFSDKEALHKNLLQTYSSSKRVRPATDLLSERRRLQNDNPTS